MPNHDPLKFASALSAKLAARSRHICIFFGAGVGRACGLPDITQLQAKVRGRLPEPDRPILARLLDGRNLEGALSRLRRISALVNGAATVDDLTADKAKTLDTAICQAIVAELRVDAAQLDPMLNLAAWATRAGYQLPVELFTVNYDLLPETAFERLRVPYFDGFVGNLKARFHTELVETEPGTKPEAMPPFFVRLWKLHGSVNWAWEGERQIVRLGQAVTDGMAAAIYPSDAKYDESRRIPFIVLQDRLRRALHQPETLVIICGYSFGDDHLNEMIFDAATRRERSEVVALCYDPIPAGLAERALRTPNLQVADANTAILGGVRGDWSAGEDVPDAIWQDNAFALRDFRKLAAYLAKSARIDPALMAQAND